MLSEVETADLDQRRGKVRRAIYFRQTVFGRPPVKIPEINQSAFVELRKIGTNLNQIARRLNSEPSNRELAEAASAEVTALRNALTIATPGHSDEANE